MRASGLISELVQAVAWEPQDTGEQLEMSLGQEQLGVGEGRTRKDAASVDASFAERIASKEWEQALFVGQAHRTDF